MTESDDLPNLAILFPAVGSYWREFESITIKDAALLSLDVEPREILEVQQQEQADAFNFLTGVLETEGPLWHLGQQHADFKLRHDVISDAISCKVLLTVGEKEKGTSKRIRLVEFVTWASAKQWPMPTWLSELGPGSPQPKAQPGRESQLAKTQERYRRWQQEAERLKSSNRSLSKAAIAEMISKSSIGDGAYANTIRQNIDV